MRRIGSIVLAGVVLVGCAAPAEPPERTAGWSFPSRATVSFASGLGQSFLLVQSTARLDGEAVQECDAGEGRLDTSGGAWLLHDGPLAAGEHLLELHLRYRGNGAGVFSYLRGYRFDVRSEHRFEAPPGETLRLHVVAYERGEATTPLEDRPAIRFEQGEGPPLPLPPGCPARLPLD